MYGLNNDTAPNLILVKTALDKLLDESQLQNNRTGKASATDPIIFTQDNATNAAVVTSVIGGGGYFAKRTNDLSPNKEVAKRASAARTTLIAEFDKDLAITRTFMADQQQSAVSKAVRQESMSWDASRDQNAFGIYGNGYTTSVYTTIDGVALYSNTHTNLNGDTIDNLETGAMSDANLNTLVVSMRNQKNQEGVKVGYEPDFLLTSNAGHHDAIITAKSVLRGGTGNNDANYFSELFPGMQVKYNQFLDDYSTTAYEIGAQGLDVYRFEREGLSTELVDWKISAAAGGPDAYKYLLRAREEVDAITYVGTAGSTGTT